MRSFFGVALGFSGVDERENAKAIRVGHWFEWPMLVAAIWLVLEWYLTVAGLSSEWFSSITGWSLWGFFVLETAILTYLVDNKRRYLLSNWSNLVIILVGVPWIWQLNPYAGILRVLRLLVLLTMLMNASNGLRRVLSRNHLGTTLMVSFILVVLAGTVMAILDPNVATPLDGIWWAWVTITTVGYGDIVPSTMVGRLFAAFLSLLGVGLFAMLTASFSTYFMSEQEDSDETLQLNAMEQRLLRIEQQLDQLLQQSQSTRKDDESKS